MSWNGGQGNRDVWGRPTYSFSHINQRMHVTSTRYNPTIGGNVYGMRTTNPPDYSHITHRPSYAMSFQSRQEQVSVPTPLVGLNYTPATSFTPQMTVTAASASVSQAIAAATAARTSSNAPIIKTTTPKVAAAVVSSPKQKSVNNSNINEVLCQPKNDLPTPMKEVELSHNKTENVKKLEDKSKTISDMVVDSSDTNVMDSNDSLSEFAWPNPLNKGKKIMPQALFCHICEVDEFKSTMELDDHMNSKGHREVLDAYQLKNQMLLNIMRDDSKIAALKGFTEKDDGELDEEEVLFCLQCQCKFTGLKDQHDKTGQHMLVQKYLSGYCCGRCFGFNSKTSTRYQLEQHWLSYEHMQYTFNKKKVPYKSTRPSTTKTELTDDNEVKLEWKDYSQNESRIDQLDPLGGSITNLSISDLQPYDSDLPYVSQYMTTLLSFHCLLCDCNLLPTEEMIIKHCSTAGHYRKLTELQRQKEKEAERKMAMQVKSNNNNKFNEPHKNYSSSTFANIQNVQNQSFNQYCNQNQIDTNPFKSNRGNISMNQHYFDAMEEDMELINEVGVKLDLTNELKVLREKMQWQQQRNQMYGLNLNEIGEVIDF